MNNVVDFDKESAEDILFKHWKAWIEKTFENSDPVTIEQLKEDTSFEQVCIPAMIEFRSQPQGENNDAWEINNAAYEQGYKDASDGLEAKFKEIILKKEGKNQLFTSPPPNRSKQK